MRTPAQALREAIKSGAVEAFGRGEKIQASDGGGWEDWEPTHEGHAPVFHLHGTVWRPSPTKRRIPFTLSTAPKHALWRVAGPGHPFYTVNVYGEDGLILNSNTVVTWVNLSESFEYSIDGGVTWERANQEVAP